MAEKNTNITSPIDTMGPPSGGSAPAQKPLSVNSPIDTSMGGYTATGGGVFDGVKDGPFGKYSRTVGGPPEKVMETLPGGKTTTVNTPVDQKSDIPNRSGY